MLLWEGWTKLIKSIYNVFFSIGVPHHRLLCLVRLEVLQEKAAQGQEERKGWEGKGDERNIRKHHFLDDNCQKQEFYSETYLSSSLRRRKHGELYLERKLCEEKQKDQD